MTAKTDKGGVPANTLAGALPAEFDAASLVTDAQEMGNQFTRQDLAIPFLLLLQDLSPYVKKQKAEYVQGAEPGMFFNSVLKRLHDGAKGIVLVPVAFTRNYTEWKPNRGGLVKDHGTDESVLAQTKRNDKNEDVLPNGNTVLTSGMHFCLLVNPEDGSFEQLIVSLSKTQLKKSRTWNTQLATKQVKYVDVGIDPTKLNPPLPAGATFNPPSFFSCFLATAVMETKGENDYFGWKLVEHEASGGCTLKLPNGAAIYKAAKEFRKLIDEGKVKVAEQNEDLHGGGEGASGEGDAF
jgi:hypothetical protein